MKRETKKPLTTDPITWLQQEYLAIKAKNPRYSLRAFARRLGLNVGNVSDLFHNKRVLTRHLAEKIVTHLDWPEAQRKEFLQLVRNQNLLSKTQNWLSDCSDKMSGYELPPAEAGETLLKNDYYVLLNLLKTRGCKSSPKWMAKRLGLSLNEVNATLKALLQMGFIEEKEGKFIRSARNLTSTYEIPSAVLRSFHKRRLKLAIQSLEEVSLQLRDITGFTIPLDVTKIGLAKESIKVFLSSMSELMEGEAATEVYHLGVVLFPLTRKN